MGGGMNESRILHTIGYSTHELETLIALLHQHAITAVADVRSHPVSRLAHFCRPALERHLKNTRIEYVFLGQELGARRDEPECYVDGQARYDRITSLPAFRKGIERLERGAKRYRIALMCAEKEPLDCHRSILICRHLVANGWEIRHVLANGAIEPHATTEERLVRRMEIERTLFQPTLTRDELVQQAYEKRAAQIAYRPSDEH